MNSIIIIKCIKINFSILKINLDKKLVNLILNHITGLHSKLRYLVIFGSFFFLLYYYLIFIIFRKKIEFMLFNTSYIRDIFRFYRKLILLHHYDKS